MQKKKSPVGKVGSREEFKQRLGRVARNPPAKFIDDSIGDLAGRCQKLYAAKAGFLRKVAVRSVGALCLSTAISAQCSSMSAPRAYAIPLPVLHFDTPTHHKCFILGRSMDARS